MAPGGAGLMATYLSDATLLRRLENLFRRVRLLEKRTGLERSDVDPEGEGES